MSTLSIILVLFAIWIALMMIYQQAARIADALEQWLRRPYSK
jgi:hypothetical protein